MKNNIIDRYFSGNLSEDERFFFFLLFYRNVSFREKVVSTALIIKTIKRCKNKDSPIKI